MHVFNLLLALKKLLEPALLELQLPRLASAKERSLTFGPARVFLGGFTPSGPGQAVENVPFVTIQALNGTEEDGEQRVEVAFRVAVRDEDPEAAENQLHNLISLVRHTVMACRGRPLEKRYRLDEGGKGLCPWTRPDAQEPPFLEAYILTSWLMKGFE